MERELQNQYQRKWSLERRDKINKLKTGPCKDCGQSFPTVCMDFDHRPTEEKKFSISSKQRNAWETVLKEIEKCDLVCANCHRIRTASRIMLKPNRFRHQRGPMTDAHIFKCGHPRTDENSLWQNKPRRASRCKACNRQRGLKKVNNGKQQKLLRGRDR